MNKDSLTRRHFLQSTGIASGAILGLSLLPPRSAHAMIRIGRAEIGLQRLDACPLIIASLLPGWQAVLFGVAGRE
jgi:hypothetical protein